jgi:NADPH2:quinone reductase
MSKVRAILVNPEVAGRLSLGDVEAPAPRSNEALVRVHAISLNRGEVNRAQNSPAGLLLGWDIGGVVEKAATDGTGPKEGARVVGVLQTGAWAEQIAVPSTNLAVLPESVSFPQASTLPVAGLTALYALDRSPGLNGRNLLVTGASGGVGIFAVQLAKHGGATVTGLVRQEKHAQSVRDAGADHVIADETGEAAREYAPYNVILEAVGGSVIANVLSMLAQFGVMVVYGVSMGGQVTLDSGVFLRTRGNVQGLAVFTELQKETAGAGLTRLVKLVDQGVVKPQISVQAPWSEVGNVARQLLERGFPGKAVLTLE